VPEHRDSDLARLEGDEHRQGLYDIHLNFSIDGTGDYPAIPAALEEQLGLRLAPARGTREFLVIERVERPAGN
jgi:uncharacterized protein (TIGR03435 family)